MQQLNDVADASQFCLAGNAILTLRSAKTGTRYTYRVRKVEDRYDRWFVQLLTGPENTSDYTYLGLLEGKPDGFMFRLTKASKMTAEAPPCLAFRFFTQQVLTQHSLPANLEVFHEGRCGRCGRTLTVPESIERGIGPECANRMMVTS